MSLYNIANYKLFISFSISNSTVKFSSLISETVLIYSSTVYQVMDARQIAGL